MILPLGHPVGRGCAQISPARTQGLARGRARVSITSVGLADALLSGPACLYRYPSPTGRSLPPKLRPPTFLQNSRYHIRRCTGQTVGIRRLSAYPATVSATLCHLRDPALRGSGEPVNLTLSSLIIVRSMTACRLEKSSFPSPWLRGFRPAATRLANRRLSVQAPARLPRRSQAAMSGQGPLSARRPMSPIVKDFPAAATDAAGGAAAFAAGHVTTEQSNHRTTPALCCGGLFHDIRTAAFTPAEGR